MIKFDLQWDEKIPKGDIDTVTSGFCTATVNKNLIWNKLSANWIEFLEHLIASWDSIFMDGSLKSNASEIDRFEYELNHDLAKGIKRKIAPSILIYRYGNDFEIQIGEQKLRPTYVEISNALNFIGNSISQRISKHQDPRARAAVAKWGKRKQHKNGHR